MIKPGVRTTVKCCELKFERVKIYPVELTTSLELLIDIARQNVSTWQVTLHYSIGAAEDGFSEDGLKMRCPYRTARSGRREG